MYGSKVLRIVFKDLLSYLILVKRFVDTSSWKFKQGKQKIIESQYYQLIKQSSSKYEVNNYKVNQRFHRKATEAELVRSHINN